jgi:integrase
MAGVRKKPQSSGKYQGWFVAMDGRSKFFVGTRSRSETLRMAQRFEDEDRQIRLGYRPPPRPSDRHQTRPVADVIQEYLAWGQLQGGLQGYPWSATHVRNRRHHLHWWQQTLGLEVLGDLCDILTQVETAIQRLSQDHRSITVTQNAASLAAFCAWCVTHQYLATDPLQALGRLATTPHTHRRAMTVAEIQRLLAVAPVHYRFLYETAFQSGLRANEIRSLTLAHLDRVRLGLRLDAAWTKNRQASFHPLPAQLVEDLYAFASAGYPQDLYARKVPQWRQALPGEPLLFVPSRPAHALAAHLRRAGIPQHTVEGKLDFHALRLAYINLVIEAGATVKEAQTLARHAKPQMTMGVYGRTREERLHQVVEQVATVLHDETQRVSSVHRANLEEHARAVYASDSNAYSSSCPEGSAVCYAA